MAVPFKLTTDGFETQWQTNHLAPFLLTKTLLPILESTAASSGTKSRVRIVNVSSDAAVLPPTPKQLDLARPNLEYVTGFMNLWYVAQLSQHPETGKMSSLAITPSIPPPLMRLQDTIRPLKNRQRRPRARPTRPPPQ